MVVFVMSNFACGQASSPAERQEKKEGVEKATEEREESKAREVTTAQATVRCEDFISREAAQEYLNTRATSADKKKKDSDNNDKACDEGAYIFAGGGDGSISSTASAAPASATSSSAMSMSAEEQAAQAEANCRLVAYAQEEGMSQQEANDFSTGEP
jgi:hypothetical protein